MGEALSSQLTISSRAHKASTPIVISQIKIVFEGGLNNVILNHDANKRPEASTVDGKILLHQIALHKVSANASSMLSSLEDAQTSPPLVGSADLAIAPGMSRALSLSHNPRDSADIVVMSVTLFVKLDTFDFEICFSEQIEQEALWITSPLGISKRKLKSERSSMVKVQPKPPKVEVDLYNTSSIYYTNEKIALGFRITNREDEEADITLDSVILGSTRTHPRMTWESDVEANWKSSGIAEGSISLQNDGHRLSRCLGFLKPGETQSQKIYIQATSEPVAFAIELKARYQLLSDPETTVFKSFSANINIVPPFEANHSFSPMVDVSLWPSYFEVEDLKEDREFVPLEQPIAKGLSQSWTLTSRLASLADEPLSVENVDVRIVATHEDAICKVSPANEVTSEPLIIYPNDKQDFTYILHIQKLLLEDRRSTILGLQLCVSWRRKDSLQPSTPTNIAISELAIPFGEPRVLASARNSQLPQELIYVDYVIENPSMYTLTFNLSMESSEEFAFSGPKSVTMQLIPLSRHTIYYSLLPLVKGVWISPQFRVFDTHFHKTLKVNATGEMRNDKRGVTLWVDVNS